MEDAIIILKGLLGLPFFGHHLCYQPFPFLLLPTKIIKVS